MSETILGFIYSYNLSGYISLLKIMTWILQMRKLRMREVKSSSRVHTAISGSLNLLPFIMQATLDFDFRISFLSYLYALCPCIVPQLFSQMNSHDFFFLWKINFKKDFDSLALAIKY